jgi:hypothetical protein
MSKDFTPLNKIESEQMDAIMAEYKGLTEETLLTLLWNSFRAIKFLSTKTDKDWTYYVSERFGINRDDFIDIKTDRNTVEPRTISFATYSHFCRKYNIPTTIKGKPKTMKRMGYDIYEYETSHDIGDEIGLYVNGLY